MSATTAVHSNAFNFQSYVQGGVDPRTGQYTLSLSLPELKSNALAGPVIPLTLAFNPMNVRDGGFGHGWGINLTEYAPQTGMLSLGTGEVFKVAGSGQTPGIEEKKLDSFHFHVLGSDQFRVMHRSGLVEMLRTMGTIQRRLALPEEVLGPDGRRLALGYAAFKGEQRLESVSDPDGVVLRINRNDTAAEVELLFYPGQGAGGGAMARYVLELDAYDRAVKVVLPTEERACWKLGYELIRGIVCVKEVWTPTGAHETIDYEDGGHPFPGGAHPPLPRVTKHTVEPGFDQPTMEVRYTYSHTNFLGHGALDGWVEGGADNLYRVADADFSYGSTAVQWSEGKPVRTVQRSYNRFHLLSEESTTQGGCRKRVVTRYHADDEANRYKPFKDQPPQCQLPMRIETHWEVVDGSRTPRTEIVETLFDEHGNLIWQANADGTQETSTYFDIDGEPGLCPPDPERFKRQLRTRTVTPAVSPYGSAVALTTNYAYVALDPLPGTFNERFLVESAQILVEEGGDELQRIETTYFDDPGDALQHGRPQQVTTTLAGLSTSVEYEYARLDSARAGAHVLQVRETINGFDGCRRILTQEHSLLNGEPLLVQDDNGVEIRYAYDALGRVVEETVAPGTEYLASRTYTYHLVGGEGDTQAWQLMSDVKQVQTRTWFDGVARAVEEERQDVDGAVLAGTNPGEAGFRPTYRASYNALGELLSETEIDWLGSETRDLTTTYGYDDWGERATSQRPDGVVEHDETDPIGRDASPGVVQRRWLVAKGGKAGGVIETWLDPSGEPVRVERFNSAGTSISLELQHRDGLGRLAEHIDPRNRATRYRYDAFDRVVETTLPGGALVTRGYAAHSSGDLPVSISVNGTLLGTQAFDGLERRTEATTGGRVRTFQFEGSKARPTLVETPSGKVIRYEYLEQLGDEVHTRVLPDAEASYSYDLQNSQLTGCSEHGIGLQREYYSTGEIKNETHTYDGAGTHVSEYTYSLRGRLLESHLLGASQINTYDAVGRIHSSTLGSTDVTFTYDTFGRVEDIVTSDREGSSSLTISVAYDDFGRETLRTFNANGAVRTLEQTYHADDALNTRKLFEGTALMRGETFTYDQRGRLQVHRCEGPELPRDAYGKAFTQQVFISDELDNFLQVRTIWGPGADNDVATFSYDGVDPVQLTGIKHTHADYPPTIALEYDLDGNLLQDEQGRSMTYDALGRLTDVDAADGAAAATYRFDALDVLAERRSGASSERRYYVDGELAARSDDARRSIYLRAGGHVMAEQLAGANAGTVLLATDRSSTVLGEVRPGAEQHSAYTAYGFPSRGPLWTELAYNGELHETGTGWQLLGNGYRAFNPVLMRFHSPDDVSPFGQGGINAYAYCTNDPINFVDPQGRWGVGAIFAAIAAAGIGSVIGAKFVEDKTLKSVLTIAGVVAIGVGALGGMAAVFGRKVGRSMHAGNKPAWSGQRGVQKVPKKPTVKNDGGSTVKTTEPQLPDKGYVRNRFGKAQPVDSTFQNTAGSVSPAGQELVGGRGALLRRQSDEISMASSGPSLSGQGGVGFIGKTPKASMVRGAGGRSAGTPRDPRTKTAKLNQSIRQ